MKTNKNLKWKEFEENWGNYCVMMVLVGGQVGKNEFDTKEKTIDEKNESYSVELCQIIDNSRN